MLTPILVVVACLALGAAVGGAAYLITSGDDPEVAEVGPPAASATISEDDGEEPTDADGSQSAADTDADGYPTVSRAQMRADIEDLIRRYHEAIVARRFSEVWDLLTQRKRDQALQEGTFKEWRSNQATLSPYLDASGLRVRIDELEGDGVARILITGMGWSAPGSSCSEWSGLTWVKYENGAWLRDPGYSTTPEREAEWKPRRSELLGVGC